MHPAHRALFAIALALLYGEGASAQHAAHAEDAAQPEHEAPEQTSQVLPPHARMSSGTSWLPDSSPMHAVHARAADWTFMFHGTAFAGYNHQGSPRGDTQWTSVNWIMAMASHPALGGNAHFRLMMSAEPFTLPGDGYPLLLQTGESWEGRPLRDRQHPHDLFMELAVLQQIPLSGDLGLELYLAPVGEPAVGPTAFPHRPSAMADPLAPLGHHWQDSTHITFGVLTAGLFGRRWKLEGSWFNGREPDEQRYDFDVRVPDSYAARFSLNPSRAWSTQVSYALLESPEAHHADESVHRMTASIAHTVRVSSSGFWASTFVLGVNAGGGDDIGPAALLESTLDLDGHNVVFGRAELLGKSAEALTLDGVPEEQRFSIGSLALGYQHAFGPVASLTPALGGRAAVTSVPSALERHYDTRLPVGAMVYVQLRPAEQRAAHAH